jgi:flagellar operon protein
MNDRWWPGHLPIGQTGRVTGGYAVPKPRNVRGETKELSFRQVLEQKQLKFSQHAEQRLRQRGIQFAPEQLGEIARAVDQAAAKGARDSLVLYHDVAMIVSVPNRTVVTAMDGAFMKEHVFTQIDSAVIVR